MSTNTNTFPDCPTDPTTTILIIQHNTNCPPGYIITFCHKYSLNYYIYNIYNENITKIPFDIHWKAIITLGGPQAAYETDLYPYLIWEKEFLKSHFDNNRPVLGICLGAQILADVIGGNAYKGAVFEVGYPELSITKEGMLDETIQHLLNGDCILDKKDSNHTTTTVALARPLLSHHGDTFQLPENASILLKSSLYTQAYKIKNIYGVQFHPEAGEAEIANWVKGDSDAKLAAVGQTREGVMAEIRARRDEATKASELFFEAWWKTVEHHANESMFTY